MSEPTKKFSVPQCCKTCVQGTGTRRDDLGRWCLSEQPISGVPEIRLPKLSQQEPCVPPHGFWPVTIVAGRHGRHAHWQIHLGPQIATREAKVHGNAHRTDLADPFRLQFWLCTCKVYAAFEELLIQGRQSLAGDHGQSSSDHESFVFRSICPGA
jgi:hypothetical protein